MKRLATWIAVFVLVVASAEAADFSIHYQAKTRQVWFLGPQDARGGYRFCAVTLGPEGDPRSAIVANDARYADGLWHIRTGRELIFERGTLIAESAKKVVGVRPELLLDPQRIGATDARIKKIGSAYLFSEEASASSYKNASIFTISDQSHVMTYHFARHAVIVPGKKEGAVRFGYNLMVRITPDDRVPEMATSEKFEFP